MTSSLPNKSLSGLAVAAALAGLAAPAVAQTVIGVSAPLTGPRAMLGRNFKNGVEMAVAEINKAGGVLGKPVQVVYEDDQADNPNAAMNAVNRLMKVDKVPLMIGPHFSVAQLATQKSYCDGSILSITGASGIPVTANGCKYVVRTRANDNTQSKALVAYAMNTLKLNKIGVIYVNDDFGKAGADRVVQNIKDMGLTPVGVEGHNAEDKDFSAQLGRLRSAGAQMVILWTHDNEAALIVRQAKQMGLPIKFAGSTSLSQPVFIKLAGDAGEGAISSSDFVPSNPDPKTRDFVKKFQQQYKYEAELYAATYYDATWLAVKAIQLAGSAEPAKVRDAFARIQYSGILGDYKCEANGDCNHQIHIVEVHKGQPVVKSTVKF
jgi:branched-chain amino acid transport system substrate-binding protein